MKPDKHCSNKQLFRPPVHLVLSAPLHFKHTHTHTPHSHIGSLKPHIWLTDPWGLKGKGHPSWPLKSSMTPCSETTTAGAELKRSCPGRCRPIERGAASKQRPSGTGTNQSTWSVICRGIWSSVASGRSFDNQEAFRRFRPHVHIMDDYWLRLLIMLLVPYTDGHKGLWYRKKTSGAAVTCLCMRS